MRQATNPQMPVLGSDMSNKSPIEEIELIYQLTKASSSARMLSQQKKDFLNLVLDNKKGILEHCKAFDSILDTPLHDSIASLLPVNKRVIDRDSNNTELATMVSKLLNPLKVLRTNVLSQYEEEKERKAHILCSSELPKETPVLKVLNKSFELFKVLEQDIYAHRTIPTIHTVVKPLKLTSIQRQRKWSKDLVPVQSQIQNCAMCGHKSTNLAPENQEIIEHNMIKEKKYQESLKQWDEYVRKVTNGDKSAKKPNGLKRRPQRRNNFREPIILCKCSMSYCLGEFEETSNSCPIKCIKSNNHSKASVSSNTSKEDGVILCLPVNDDDTKNIDDRYPFVTERKNKYCSCPICMCKCSFHCTIAEVPKVLLYRKINGPETSRNATNVSTIGEGSMYETTPQVFFQDIFKESAKICYSTIKQQNDNLNMKNKLNFMSSNQNDLEPGNQINIENRGVAAACEFAATNIVSRSQALTMLDRKNMKKSVGKPSTIVKLPSGDFFDTKLLAGNDQHARNNKLGKMSEYEMYKPEPGMKSNLDIDWSNQCDEYTNMIGNFDNVKKELTTKPSKGTNEFENDDDSIEITKIINCVSNTLVIKDENDLDIKKPTAKELALMKKMTVVTAKSEPVERMHNRVMKKARSKLTLAIKNTLETDANDAKAKALSLKNTVRSIENSVREQRHVDIIKSVTSDGKDLEYDGIDTIDSNDVYERVKLFHDLEQHD